MLHARKSGILLHPSSLPSHFGIGDFGENAYTFVKYLKKSNQALWQILPLCPVDDSGSPYQSPSAFAGEPLLIDLYTLAKEGLLSVAEVESAAICHDGFTDYSRARSVKMPLFRRAHTAFLKMPIPQDYKVFCEKNAFWLEEYTLYAALKAELGGVSWREFPMSLRKREAKAVAQAKKRLKEEMGFFSFLQFEFEKQWHGVKAYANENGIEIIGDIPIFVSYDSADVWTNQKLFQLDATGDPLSVAGVPPDYFSETGQLWGNPLYRWETHKKTGYHWWKARLEKALSDADILRIDHFRGFETYWEVPFGAKDARGGTWQPGPGLDFFRELEKALGKLPLIAEDLGIITDEVRALREAAGFPGMRILQFAFGNDKNNPYLPHSYDRNTVVYTGTHDNDTSIGWYETATEEEKDHYRRYFNTDGSSPGWDFIRLAFSSSADMAVVPLQDVLMLDGAYRMNTPGTVEGNWRFAFQWEMWRESMTEGLSYLCNLFGRNQ